ncbi:MAG TPA: SCO family protein [Edaphocola sp.]|nr:SCO family protein [Edaphocola sp.]
MKPTTKKTGIFLIAFFIAIMAVFAFYYNNMTAEARAPKELAYLGEEDHKVRDFSFLNQDGDTISLETLKGKILVVEYFFTTCKGICPTMNENMAEVYSTFKNDDDVVIISHTVDPKRDTVGALKEFAKGFDADSKHWMFLTGDKEELYNQAEYSYLVSAIDSSDTDIKEKFIHTENFVLVDRSHRVRAHMDKDGRVRPYNGTDMASVNQMIKDIRQLQSDGQ